MFQQLQQRQPTIDIAMISTLRPDIITTTLSSIKSRVKYGGDLRLILDVAPVGEKGVTQADIADVARGFFDNVVARTRRVSLQAEAQRWVWSKSTSEHVLQWEDDWEAMANIDLDKLVPLFDRHPECAMVFLDRVGKSVRAYEGYRGMFERVETGVYKRIKHKNFGGPPALVCRPFLLGVCEHIKDNESLDTTCRAKAGQRFLRPWEFLVYAPNNRGLVRDIGKPWLAARGLRMEKKSSKGVRWVKK